MQSRFLLQQFESFAAAFGYDAGAGTGTGPGSGHGHEKRCGQVNFTDLVKDQGDYRAGLHARPP